MYNSKIADIFRDMARILEIKGDNPFRIRAYERAAQNIESLNEDIETYIKEGRLKTIPGIGQDLADKIVEIVKTADLKAYQQLKKTIPEGLLELLKIASIGPKTAKLLYEKLNIKDINELEKAIKQKKLKGLSGIKEKAVQNILRGIELFKKHKERLPLSTAEVIANDFMTVLKKSTAVNKINPAGSLRRRKETVRDIDILITSKQPSKVMDVFTQHPLVKQILSQGHTKSSVLTPEGIQVDCRVVADKSYGAALMYFTGSKDFNIHLRKIAQKRNLKINEYGVFSGNKYIAGREEVDIFKLLDLEFIEPELREDIGEIELAAKNKLPVLIKIKDLKADLHIHSKWSDGANSIEEIAEASKKRGYCYIAIADHSQSLKVAGGLSISDLKKKRKEIATVNKTQKGLRILYSAEVDIDSEGKLDYKDEILKEFDIVVAAIHSGFRQSKEKLTRRIIRACQNRYVNIIAHPTGRLLGVRQAYELDFDKVFKAAKQTNTALEINAFPQRLDLNDVYARAAKEAGVKMVISTDAHTVSQLDTIRFGIATARRGWLTKQDVLNTLPVEELLKALKK
jgi:DNA polymerase (family 10)